MFDIQIDCLLDKKYSEISSITKYIDNTIYDDTMSSIINDENYDFSISFYSSFTIGYKLWLSNISKDMPLLRSLLKFFTTEKSNKIDHFHSNLSMNIIIILLSFF